MTEIKLTDEQKQAANIIRNSPVSLLIGAPGVGKTFLSKAIITEFVKSGRKVLLCAPSGKAARKLSQSSGREASTIHSMLAAKMTGNGFKFMFNEGNKLPADFIIEDECSMVDSALMSDLLRAVKRTTKLLFIGDDNQLLPVGLGCVLRDFIASGVFPIAELTEIQRNSGQIVESCHMIKNDKAYIPSITIDTDTGKNLIHVE